MQTDYRRQGCILKRRNEKESNRKKNMSIYAYIDILCTGFDSLLFRLFAIHSFARPQVRER